MSLWAVTNTYLVYLSIYLAGVGAFWCISRLCLILGSLTFSLAYILDLFS